MTDAYHAESALDLDETLTVLRLGVPPTLARTLRSTNCIESMISVCREHASNVKRWCAAGMVEAGKHRTRGASPGSR